MSPQINFIWVAIVAVLYFVAWRLLAGLAKELGPRRWRWYVIAPIATVVLAAPWVDELWIAWRFGELCKDAGVHVLRKVEVDGFYDDYIRSGYDWVDRKEYRFMEHKSLDGKKVEHVEKTGDGKWRVTISDTPSARYHFKKTRDDVDVGYQLSAIEYAVIDSRNGETIGRRVIYKRYPGWINGLWTRFLGSGMTMCPDPERGPPQPLFPQSVLIPANTK